LEPDGIHRTGRTAIGRVRRLDRPSEGPYHASFPNALHPEVEGGDGRPSELAKGSLRGEDFAKAFTAALACTAEGYENDESVRKRIRDASPLFLVSPDDPPAFIAGAWSGDEPDPAEAPAIILDPHSAWHGILLADAMRRAGVHAVTRLEIEKDPRAGNVAIVKFLRDQLR